MISLKDYRLNVGFLTAGFIAFISSVPRFVLNLDQPDYRDAFILFVTSFTLTLFSWLFNFCLLNFKSSNMVVRRGVNSNLVRVVVSVIMSLFLGMVFASLLYFFVKPEPYYLDRYESFGQLSIWATFRCMLINGFVIILKYTIDMTEEKKDIKIGNERLVKERISAQFEALKQQLNPHFLFNSLSTLNSMIKQNHQASGDFVIRISQVYRYLLQHNKGNVVLLTQEIEFMEGYVFLLKSRFGDNLSINMNIEEHFLHDYIPPVSLQLLVENAIKHNIVSAAKPLSINIYTDGQHLVVANNLQLRKNRGESAGVGLGSISTRYELLNAGKVIVKSDGNTFCVKLPLIKMI